MKVVPYIIDKFASWAVGKDLFITTKKLVLELSTNEKLTGPEKRERVLDALEDFGKELGLFIVNLAIELAVFYVKKTI